jgi:preprotein translocase subunit SecY
MWMGEQITQSGLGQGASVLIFANIVAGMPAGLFKMANSLHIGELDLLFGLAIGLFALGLTAAIIFIERGERRIPVQYARRVVGNRVFGGVNTYIPLKLNSAGVMPVILTGTMLGGFGMLFQRVITWFGTRGIVADIFDPSSPFYTVLPMACIIVFSFMYTGITHNPEELAENVRKAGGFVPGIRPGKRTAAFFEYILVRLGTTGALYLAIIAVFPGILLKALSSPIMLSGISLLIAVGVSMDTAAQIDAVLLERRYEGFLRHKKRS